jgi:hypothetical protein
MYNVPDTNRETITFSLEATPNTNAKLIFTNRKTILQARPNKDGNLCFKDIPRNEPATILVTDTRSGSNTILAQKIELVTGANTIIPNFTAMHLQQYITLVDSFGK